MTNLLKFQAKDFANEDLHAAFSTLNEKLNTKEESACVLRMANRVFARKNFAVKDTFTAGNHHMIIDCQSSKYVARNSFHLGWNSRG